MYTNYQSKHFHGYTIIKLTGFVISNDSELIATTDCILLGQNVTYECTTCTINASFTSWNGSIMDPSGCTISLSHRTRLSFFNETMAICNEGMVVGQGLAINNTCYTSLLTVLVTPQVNGGNVSCFVDDMNNEQVLINTTIINITTGIILCLLVSFEL
ncbi:MAG: hypothetical protein MJE68_16605 [Proteobacteria bacterium]|nr:hypothetical protein [Pseudomonadota bacterium]